jgi:hypothetical protein
MQVTEVRTVVRYSSEAKGAWRSIEVGATATLTASDETLESAQAELYNRLASQLKLLWHKGNGKPVLSIAEGTETPAETQSPNPNWCVEHHTEFRQFSKNGNSWFSHKTADGSWHNRGT